MIKKVENNQEKRNTYAVLNKKCREALDNKEYETVLLYSYAMIEDRLLSMLHYLYVVNRYDDKLVPADYIDRIIRPLLKYNIDADKNKIYKINNISTKIKLIKIFNKKNIDVSDYIKDGYTIIDKNIGEDNLKKYFKELNKWIKIRNEIVHASFNKDINDLYLNIEIVSKKGLELARTISRYTNLIKDNYKQISLRIKWNGIVEVFKDIYKEDFSYDSLNNAKYLTEYDITYPTFYEFIGCDSDELDNLKKIILNEDFFENKNDLNIVIKDQLLKKHSAYKDYIMALNGVMAYGWKFGITKDQFKEYLELDKRFKINDYRKKEIIREQLSINYLGGDRECFMYYMNYIRDNYFYGFNLFNKEDVLRYIKKDDFNVIGLTNKQLKDKEIREYLNELCDEGKCSCEVIYDYIYNVLGREDNDEEIEIIDDVPYYLD